MAMGNCHNFLFSYMNFCAFIMDDTERSVGEHCFPRCRSCGRDREKEEIPVIDRQAFRNTIASIKHQPAFVCSQTAATKAGLLCVSFSQQPLQNRVPGNACSRRRWRIQRAGVGAAVETARVKASIGRFGHRKRGCKATSSPSAPATGKALKPLGFKAFSSLWRGRRTSVLPHFDAQKRGQFSIRR